LIDEELLWGFTVLVSISVVWMDSAN